MWFDSTATALSWMIFGHHLSWVMSLFLFDESWPSHSKKRFFETGVFPKNWRKSYGPWFFETDLGCDPAWGLWSWGNIPSEFTGVMLLTLLNGKGFKVPFGSDWRMAAVCLLLRGGCRCKQGRMMLFFFGRGGGSGRGLGGAWGFANLDQVSWLIVVFFFVDFMSHFWLHSEGS